MDQTLLILVLLVVFLYSVQCQSRGSARWRNEDRLNQNSKPNTTLMRKKRFLFPATSPWRFDAAFTLFVPLDGTPIIGNPFVAFLPFTFNLNTMTFAGGSSFIDSKRSFNNKMTERFSIIKAIEDGLGPVTKVKTFHECLVQIVCQVAEMPSSGDGLIGDVFNLLLTPISDVSKAIDGLGDNTTTLFEDWQLDYLMAQHDGHFKHDCSKYKSKCPISIFETSLG